MDEPRQGMVITGIEVVAKNQRSEGNLGLLLLDLLLLRLVFCRILFIMVMVEDLLDLANERCPLLLLW